MRSTLLAERDVKAIVVACNTSTAVALGALRRRYDLPILGVIRPGASAAALATRNRRVGVIATPATIRSHAYFAAIKDENPAVEVYEHATPALVPLVEAGQLSGPIAEAAVARCARAAARRARRGGRVRSSRSPPGATIDTLLLGCTHYPLLRDDHRRASRAQRSRSSTRRPPPRRRWRELLRSTGSRRPADGDGADAIVQLTTGDVGRVPRTRRPAVRRPRSPTSEPVELGGRRRR